MEKTFKILFIREIQGAIIDFRFWVVLVLCLSVIPLSFFVSVKNYSQKMSDYQQEVQSYRDNSTHVHAQFKAEGVRPPSPLSIFSRGMESKMPYKVITSREGNYQIEYPKPDNNKDLLGEIDFAFIVAFVLSILAIVFTYSSISGDKESGVLRGILSNAVLRRQVLIAKLLGNYIVFLVPFLLSMLISLMVVYSSGAIPVFSAQLFPSILMIIGISLVFLFALFNLGLWVSALTRNSILSINLLLLLWIILGLVIPKISPIIASTIFPVESTGVFEAKKTLLRTNIEKEQFKEEGELYGKLRMQFQPGKDGVSSDWTEVNAAYDEQVTPIREKYEQLLNAETEKLTVDYTIRKNKQNNIAENIARLSPINSINNLIAEFSYTGFSESDNFLQQAKDYQATVKQEVYDKFILKTYRSGGGTMSQSNIVDGIEPDQLTAPVLENYKHVDIGSIMQQNWVDIMLLCLYSLLFFVCAFISFLRFDVR